MATSIFDGLGVPLRYFSLGVTSAYFARYGGSSKLVSFLAAYSAANFFFFTFLTFSSNSSTAILGKTEEGRIPLWSFAVFWPFHGVNRFFANAVLLKTNAVDEILPNLYLGGFYGYQKFEKWEAILDLTSELPKKGNCKHYLNLPSFDGQVNQEDIKVGAQFIAKHSKLGPVLVHCAHGVGRSTTYMRAGLVEAGLATDINHAFALVKAKRAAAKSSPRNQAMLEVWQKQRT